MSVRSLFGENLSSQEYVESKLKSLYPALWLAVTETFEHLAERRAANDRAFLNLAGDDLSLFLRPQIAWRATEILEKFHPEVAVHQKKCGTQQMFTIIVDDVSVGMKRLDEDLLRSNYPTRNQAHYWQDDLFGGSLAHRVIFGYRLRKSETELSMYLTMPGQRRNAWAVPIGDQSAAAAHMRTVAAVHGRDAEERKGFRVNKIDKQDTAGGAG